MRIQVGLAGAVVRLVIVAGVVSMPGCGSAVAPGNADTPRTTLNLSAFGDDSIYYEGGPNDKFAAAELVTLTEKPWQIMGHVTGPDDVDVYELGPVEAGERILVTLNSDQTLTGAIALFDADGSSLLVNDHRNVYLGRVEPFVDVISKHALDTCFVAVSATPGFDSTGNYSLVASKEYVDTMPEPQPDVVLLDFLGTRNVKIGSRSPVNVGAFDAADIADNYEGWTDEIVREIVSRVRSDYEAYDLTILSTHEGDTIDQGVTRIFFGTYDAALLGVAEGVDEFNSTRNQQAIIFTDTFAAFMPLRPSVEEMGQAIANVVSHEIGHLLGMVHTADRAGIMDVTASLADLLSDQAFSRSPIHSEVFPLGYQNAVQYLLDTIGGDEELARSKAHHENQRKTVPNDGPAEPPARNSLHLSTCSLESG